MLSRSKNTSCTAETFVFAECNENSDVRKRLDSRTQDTTCPRLDTLIRLKERRYLKRKILELWRTFVNDKFRIISLRQGINVRS